MIPYHLHIQAGTTFALEFVYSNTDGTVPSLTGYTAKFQVRPTYSSATLTLETTPTIDVPTATVSLNLTPVQTALLTNGFVYAIELSNQTNTFRLVEGQLVVSPEVVR